MLEWRGIEVKRTGSGSNTASGGSNGEKRGDGSIGRGQKEDRLLERGLVTGLAAGVSGSFAAVVTTPVDVVKTRVMLDAASSSSPSDHSGQADGGKGVGNTRKGGIAIGKEIWRQDGIRGLFRGGLLRGVWTALGSGLYLSVYERGRQYLEDRRKVDV